MASSSYSLLHSSPIVLCRRLECKLFSERTLSPYLSCKASNIVLSALKTIRSNNKRFVSVYLNGESSLHFHYSLSLLFSFHKHSWVISLFAGTFMESMSVFAQDTCPKMCVWPPCNFFDFLPPAYKCFGHLIKEQKQYHAKLIANTHYKQSRQRESKRIICKQSIVWKTSTKSDQMDKFIKNRIYWQITHKLKFIK